MKRNETSDETFHFDTAPLRPPDPRIVILIVGFLAGVCVTVAMLVPWVTKGW